MNDVFVNFHGTVALRADKVNEKVCWYGNSEKVYGKKKCVWI